MTKNLVATDLEAGGKAPRRVAYGFLPKAVKLLQGGKDHLPPKLHRYWIAGLLGLWFFFAIVGTIASKSFMKRLPKPTTLAGGQMAIGCLLDFVLLFGCGLHRRVEWNVFKAAFPVGVTLTLGRFLTYFSYKTVAASLTHTVKASSPVFTVLLLYAIYGKCQPLSTLLSLIPIVLGVVLSAVTEMEIKADGFAAAVMAGLISTVQALYAKKSLRSQNFHPVMFHMCSCLWAAIFLIPSSFILDGPPMDIARLGGGVGEDSTIIHRVLFASFVCYWGQNLSSILVLSQINVLSHQVANVLRRFMIITCTMVYFENEITLTKICGILLALGGFLWFGFGKKKTVVDMGDIQKSSVLNVADAACMTKGATAEADTYAIEMGTIRARTD